MFDNLTIFAVMQFIGLVTGVLLIIVAIGQILHRSRRHGRLEKRPDRSCHSGNEE